MSNATIERKVQRRYDDRKRRAQQAAARRAKQGRTNG